MPTCASSGAAAPAPTWPSPPPTERARSIGYRCAPSRRGSSPNDSTDTGQSTWRSFSTRRTRSRAARARSFASGRDGDGWHTEGEPAALDHPDGLARSWAALHNPNAGDVLVSAAEGFEFTDLGGRHHAGGGSHGSLCTGDSEVPMLAVGFDSLPASITEVAPAALAHFGVEPPAYIRPLARVG